MIVASAQIYVPVLTLVSAAAYLSAAGVSQARERLGRSGAALLALAALLHAAVLLIGLTSPPRFGFAPALSMTAWLALAAYGVESLRYRMRQLRWRLALIGAITVVLAWAFPGTPIREGAPVWLALHLALGIASYGLFAVAVLHAWLMARAELRMRQGATLLREESEGAPTMLPLLTLERLTFRFVRLGFVLLSFTIVQAWLFEAPSQMVWTHKTIFSLLAWLVFAVLLWGHWHWGWRGQRAVRMIYVGAGLLLLSYVGYHFVLEVLLHRGS